MLRTCRQAGVAIKLINDREAERFRVVFQRPVLSLPATVINPPS